MLKGRGLERLGEAARRVAGSGWAVAPAVVESWRASGREEPLVAVYWGEPPRVLDVGFALYRVRLTLLFPPVGADGEWTPERELVVVPPGEAGATQMQYWHPCAIWFEEARRLSAGLRSGPVDVAVLRVDCDGFVYSGARHVLQATALEGQA